ncbi:MAG: GGDEF domain-containing protein [Pseudomonadota bacterium]
MDQSKKTFEDMRREARASASARWSRKELAQIALLKGAHQETIAPLLRDCPVQSLASGEVLLRAGEPCPALYMVLSGRLRMEGPSSTVPDIFVRAGDSIGELSLLKDAVVAPTISAAEPTRLLVVDRNIAWALIRASHEIARNWLALLAERTRVRGVIAGNEELKTTHGHLASHDEHTGLYNRHWLESMLPRQIARSTASQAPLALLLVEIDDFADYVARSGTAAGDKVCHAVAQLLVHNLRPTDVVVHYGAGQFAVVLPDSNVASACVVGERVRLAVSRDGASIPGESASLSLTVSVGVTELQASIDAPAFLAAAEAALQMATTSGGNRVGML